MSLASAMRRTTTGGRSTTVDKKFAGGDRYIGQWENGLPEGEGKYVWTDQSTYEGGWKKGMKDGLGTYWWPTGASYKGEWADGSMHGVGTFESPDGTRYQGGWAHDLKQGLGKKWFPNGDTYEGLWKAGKPDGPGRYKWRNKNDYDGEWRAGRMHGQGTLRWASGERYDGEWVEGEEHGLGVFTWCDGTTYDGFWLFGKKHGIGLYRTSQPELKRQATAAFPTGDPSVQPQAPANSESPISTPSLTGPASGDPQPPNPIQESGRTGSTGRGDRGDSVFIREYNSNSLLREDAISAEELDAVFGPFERRRERRQKRRIRTKRWEQRPGETIYKGHRSYDLMLNLQLGIRWSISRNARDPVLKNLPTSVFSEKVKQLFPRDGSKATPPHPSADFKWKDYCPTAFRQLREVFNIDPGDYMLSICGYRRGSLEGTEGFTGRVKKGFTGGVQKGFTGGVQKGLIGGVQKRFTGGVQKGFTGGVQQGFTRGVQKGFPGGVQKALTGKGFTGGVQKGSTGGYRRCSLEGYRRGDQALRELPSPGKSGSVFFLSHDDRFIIKTMRKNEVKLLLELLPKYYAHVERYPHTLLIKFYGLYRVVPNNGSKVRFIIMNNLFQTDLHIQRKYDLKGSTQGRFSGKLPSPNTILKDLDLDIRLKLEEGWHERLMKQLAADCSLMEELRVMDYSLLLGVHYRSPGYASSPHVTDKEDEGEDDTDFTPMSQDYSGGSRRTFSIDNILPHRAVDPRPLRSSRLGSTPSSRLRDRSSEGATPRASRLSAEGRAGLFPNDSAIQTSDQAQRAGAGEVWLSQPTSLGSHQDAHVDTQGLQPMASSVGLPNRQAPEPAGQLDPAILAQEGGTDPSREVHPPEAPRYSAAQVGRADDDATALTSSPHGFIKHRGRGRDLAALQQQVIAKLGRQVDEQRLQDLIKLAQYKMLSRDTRSWRSPTTVLTMRPKRTDTMRPAAFAHGGTDELAHHLGHTRVHLGLNMAATAVPIAPEEAADTAQGGSEDVVLYFGIIDILQEYNMSKRFEHSFKSLSHDGSTISAVNPRAYANRFQDFMKKVFV
ncbi:hypothetical protein ABBQ38_000603 [Trebouxia sp. C0009 RCD-2024]